MRRAEEENGEEEEQTQDEDDVLLFYCKRSSRLSDSLLRKKPFFFFFFQKARGNFVDKTLCFSEFFLVLLLIGGKLCFSSRQRKSCSFGRKSFAFRRRINSQVCNELHDSKGTRDTVCNCASCTRGATSVYKCNAPSQVFKASAPLCANNIPYLYTHILRTTHFWNMPLPRLFAVRDTTVIPRVHTGCWGQCASMHYLKPRVAAKTCARRLYA